MASMSQYQCDKCGNVSSKELKQYPTNQFLSMLSSMLTPLLLELHFVDADLFLQEQRTLLWTE